MTRPGPMIESLRLNRSRQQIQPVSPWRQGCVTSLPFSPPHYLSEAAPT